MIPSSSLHLLSQDNSIPGNRKDGFRFHHLLFISIATPLYLWLELSFGVMLLDTIGGQVVAQDTASIEHWGRLISGLAVALLFLGGWVNLSEKYDVRWPVRVGVGIGIAATCIAVNWWAQQALIDFYIQRSTAELRYALWFLGFSVLAGFLLLRFWIRYAMAREVRRYLVLFAGLAVLLISGKMVIAVGISTLVPDKTEQLGRERQQIATLTLVRRGIEEGIYALDGVQRDERTLRSAEGKAFLALFPIFGSVLEQQRFIADRPFLVRELMYRDWDQTYGASTHDAYREIEGELHALFNEAYRGAGNSARDRLLSAFEGRLPPSGLDWQGFALSPPAQRFVRAKLGCFDCAVKPDMTREEIGRELFAHTQKHNVQQAIDRFDSPQHFESGRDGERAARTYWVPIWALLFSMLGAFTHLFKMIFTVTEYAHRLTFHAVRAADSPLANRVIANSRWVTAAVVAAVALLIYFTDNRITGHERYVQLRPHIWSIHPIAGGLAAHWTVNAQGVFYPFTRKLRPQWLTFSSDPLAFLPNRDDIEP